MQPNRYDMLSNNDIEQIHEASLNVLGRTGLQITHQMAREQLADAGAQLSENRVHLTQDMVEKALNSFPKSFICAGRTEEYDTVISNTSNQVPCARTAGGCLNLFDVSSNNSRVLLLEDCKNIARISDGLQSIDIVSTLSPQDVPQAIYDIETLKVMLENSRKHIWALAASSKNLEYQLEMMKIICGSSEELSRRPICSGIVCLIEPFKFPDDEIERLLLYGKYNIPIKVPLAPMAGANSPYTLAGTLTQTNAEALGSMVLLQTLCPGIPTWYYVIMEAMDMRKGNLQLFTPEIMLLYSSVLQMARYYNLPAAAPSGISPNTQIHQILFERGISLIMNSLSGICEIGGMGAIENGMMISPELLIIDSEMMAFAKRYLTGFEINNDTLAIEAIHRQGNKGNFLEDSHTFEHLRREVRFRPMLFDWQQEINSPKKKKTIFQQATETLHKLTQEHNVPPLDDEKLIEMGAVVTSARKCLE